MFSVFPIFTDRGICGGSFSIGRVWGECGTLWVLLRIIGRCLTFERRSIHKNLWCIYGWSIASLARQLRKVCVDARFRVAIAMQQVAGRPLSCERILYVCCWRLWHSAPTAAPFRNPKSSSKFDHLLDETIFLFLMEWLLREEKLDVAKYRCWAFDSWVYSQTPLLATCPIPKNPCTTWARMQTCLCFPLLTRGIVGGKDGFFFCNPKKVLWQIKLQNKLLPVHLCLGIDVIFLVLDVSESFSEPQDSYLVDPASSHMLVSKIKPCMSKCK